jgi:hypothetical protein
MNNSTARKKQQYRINGLPSILTDYDMGFVLNEVTGEVKEVEVSHSPRVVYAATGYEQVHTLNEVPFKAWAVKEPTEAHHKYFAVAFVVTTECRVLRYKGASGDGKRSEDDGEESSEGHLEDNGRGEQKDAGSCMSKIRAALYNRSALRERCMLVSFE